MLYAQLFDDVIMMFWCAQSFPWPEGLWGFSAVAPLARSRGRRRRRRRAPVEPELDVFLRKHRIQVEHLMQPENAGKTTSRLILTLPGDPDAFQFGDCNAMIPYTVEQVCTEQKQPLMWLVRASSLPDAIIYRLQMYTTASSNSPCQTPQVDCWILLRCWRNDT